MEPLVASSVTAVLRPNAAALQSDLAGLLRDGRLLAGELVSGPSDGQVLLAIGRHHVPAQSDVRLEPGRPFLFRVEETPTGVVLHVLDGGSAREPALLAALREVVAHERPLGELLGELAARIRASLAGATTGAAAGRGEAAPGPRAEPGVLLSLLAALGAHVATPESDGGALRALLARSGLRYEELLVALARARGAEAQQLAGEARLDLKGELLRHLRLLPAGADAEALGRALAGLEAEQLVNVARQRAGEPVVWSLVVPDGTGLATARLALAARGEREGDGRGAGKPAGLRLVVGLALSGTGPLRIDFLSSEGSLAVRILAEREAVAARLAADAEEIAILLAAEGRRVAVSARAGTPEELSFAERPLDTRYLDRHHLMDVSG